MRQAEAGASSARPPGGLLAGLGERRRRPEVMDQPGLDRCLHRQALVALARVNRVTFTAERLWARARALLGGPPREVGFLDVGCGSGEVALGLHRCARRAGWRPRVAGCDVSEVAVEVAAERARARGITARFHRLDALAEELPGGYDVLVSSYFLHHFDEAPAARLLARMAGAAARGILVDDLERSRAGYFWAVVGGRLLTRSPVVKVDAPLSVAGAFTVEEAAALAERAGLTGAAFSSTWPARWVLSWSRG